MNAALEAFVVQITENYTDRGGDGGRADRIVGVTATLEDGMAMLREMGAKEGRVLHVRPPRLRADGTTAPHYPDVFPFAAPAAKKGRRAA